MDVDREPRRAACVLAPALLLCVSVLAGAAAVGALCRPRARGPARLSPFLALSLAVLLLAWTSLALFHSSSRARAWIARGKQIARTQGVSALGLSIITLLLGVDGLTREAASDAPWARACALALAVAWVLAGIASLAWALALLSREARAGHETPPALVLLRCSCCAPTVQRLAVLLPFVALAIASLVLWQRSAYDGCDEAKTPTALLLGSAVICCCMATTTAFGLAAQLVVKEPLPPSQRTRRLRQAIVLTLLVAFATVSIFWGVKCWRWLLLQNSIDACVEESTQRSVRFMAGALLTVGVLLVTTTGCCRLERQLLRTANTPQIDLAMLSPHAIRPPALTKSPHDHVV